MSLKYPVFAILLLLAVALSGCQLNPFNSSSEEKTTRPIINSPAQIETVDQGQSTPTAEPTETSLEDDLNELDNILDNISSDDFSGDDLSNQSLIQ